MIKTHKTTKHFKDNTKKSTSAQHQVMFQVFDTMSDGVCIINDRCEFEYVNPSLIREFGPVQGRTCLTYFSDDSTHCPWCKNKEVQKGKTIHWEWHSPKNKKTYEIIDASFISSDDRTTKLEIIHDISERKRHEQEIQKIQDQLAQLLAQRTEQLDEVRNYLQSIINSATEIIISFDTNGRVLTWNSSAEQLTGYSEKEVLNRQADKLPAFSSSGNILSLIKKNCEKYTSEDIVILTKLNTKKILRVSGSPIRTQNAMCIGSLFIGKDITRDIEAHGMLLAGNTYLLPSTSNETIMHLYTDLVTSGYKGYYLTRSHFEPETPIRSLANSIIVLFSEEAIPRYQTLANPDDLIAFIENVKKDTTNTMIVLDGLHYLLTRFSFSQCINTLYRMNDLIRGTHIIMVLNLHPSTVDAHQMGIFESEFQLLPSQKLDGLILEDVLSNILRFIYEQNTNNAVVSVNKIMAHFNIVYLTATKRITELEDKGLIFTKRHGKLKTVYVSEKGKALLMKRQTV